MHPLPVDTAAARRPTAVNPAPPKVQSASLDAMRERQVTVGCQTCPLPQLFLVMATQDRVEPEGITGSLRLALT